MGHAVSPTQLPTPASAALVAAAAAGAVAVAAASDESPRGKSVLDKFPCDKFPPNDK